MKMMILTTCALVASATLAQGQEQDSVKETASNPAVQEVLSQPDGVSLVRNESDGSETRETSVARPKPQNFAQRPRCPSSSMRL